MVYGGRFGLFRGSGLLLLFRPSNTSGAPVLLSNFPPAGHAGHGDGTLSQSRPVRIALQPYGPYTTTSELYPKTAKP